MFTKLLGLMLGIAAVSTSIASGPGYLIIGYGGNDYNVTTYNKANYDLSNPVSIFPWLPANSQTITYGGAYKVLGAADNEGQICYASTEVAGSPTGHGNWHIWVMDRDGGNKRQLTFDHTYAGTGFNDPSTFQDTEGAISPDGTKVAYIENYPVLIQGNYNLESVAWVITLDGSAAPQLLPPALGPGGQIAWYDALAWAPDSKRLVITGQNLYDPIDNPNNANSHWVGQAIVDVTTGASTTIHQHYNNNAGQIPDVAWSRDGNSIAFWDELGVQIERPDGTVTEVISSTESPSEDAFQFDPAGNFWMMSYRTGGLYEFDSSGNQLQFLSSQRGISTAWSFAIVDGPALNPATNVVVSTNYLSWSASGGKGTIGFKVTDANGKVLSRIVSGLNVLGSSWGSGGSYAQNFTMDGYGDVSTVQPGWSNVQFTNGSAVSSAVNVYVGHPNITYSANSSYSLYGDQWFVINRTNRGDAPENYYYNSPNITVTINGKPTTIYSGYYFLTAGQASQLVVYVPTGTFAPGTPVLVSVKESYPGGSTSASFRMVAP